MHATRFLDTNILVYAYDQDAPEKRETAIAIIEAGWNHLGQTALSVQVLQEFFVNLERRSVPQDVAAAVIADFSPWPIVTNTLELLHAGFAEQSRWQLSFWDALILAAARLSGASELITEDFSHGQDYGGICAVNPFR